MSGTRTCDPLVYGWRSSQQSHPGQGLVTRLQGEVAVLTLGPSQQRPCPQVLRFPVVRVMLEPLLPSAVPPAGPVKLADALPGAFCSQFVPGLPPGPWS